MAEKYSISIRVTKILLSIAIFKLMLISFYVIPPSDVSISILSVSLRSYIPEMTEYAVLCAVLSYPVGLLAEKLLKK